MTRKGRQIAIGVIGCGRIAQIAHLPAIAKTSNVRLVGVSDPSTRLATAVGAQYGVPSFTVTEELLAEDLDAVIVAAPDRFHLQLGLRAIELGKHVLMEKPLATTSAEAQQLADAAAARGVKLQTGTMKRHDPGLAYAHANLDRIGRILSLVTWYRVMKASRAEILQTLYPIVIEDEAVKKVEAGVKADAMRYRLATHGAHVLDTMQFFGGEFDWISANAATRDGDYTWHGTAGIAGSGGLASFEISASVHSEWSEGTDIYGELGHIKVRSPYVFTKAGSKVELYVESERVAQVPHFGDTNPFKRQLEAFGRAVLDDLPTDPSPGESVTAVRLIEAVADSCANQGRRVSLR